MGLFARIRSAESDKIPVHRLCAALGEWAVGNITRQQVVDAFTLNAESQTEIDAIAAKYSGFGNTTAGIANKAAYLWQIERAFILVETGDYNEAKVKTVLGF